MERSCLPLTSPIQKNLGQYMSGAPEFSLHSTVNWQQWNTQLSFPALMKQLATRPGSIKGIHALVDSTLWNTLRLSVGATFSLQTAGQSEAIPFVAIQEVAHVPQKRVRVRWLVC